MTGSTPDFLGNITICVRSLLEMFIDSCVIVSGSMPEIYVCF